jgi:hypothetical protein
MCWVGAEENENLRIVYSALAWYNDGLVIWCATECMVPSFHP